MIEFRTDGRAGDHLLLPEHSRADLAEVVRIARGDLEEYNDPYNRPVTSMIEQEAWRPGGVFVGRERELAELGAALDHAESGRGSLFLLVGEPGIGKSRLADELAARARERGSLVLWGRCWEAGGAPAYWPWIQALRGYVRATDPVDLAQQLGDGAGHVAQMMPDVRAVLPDVDTPDVGDPDAARFELFDAATSFLLAVSARQPILLVLDDLHAADTPSLLLLGFASAELPRGRNPCCWLVPGPGSRPRRAASTRAHRAGPPTVLPSPARSRLARA